MPIRSQELADILASSWVVAEGNEAKLPTGGGILDRALMNVIASGHFPPSFKSVRFVETPSGIRCTQLRDALTWAQASDQTADPNPSYTYTTIKHSEEVAKLVLSDLGLEVEEAIIWGRALRQSIDKELSKMESELAQ